MDDGADSPSLTGRAARGAAWIVAARFVMRILGFVNTIVLARLLVPADFGLVAVAVTGMQLLQNFSDIGVSQAVVKFRDAGRADLNTLFTLAALRGLVIALLLLLAAPFAGSFYDDPRMFWVFACIAIYPLLNGLINPKFYEFERDLDFSKEFISNAVNKLAGVAVSITIAVLFHSYIAIILGLVSGALVQLMLSYAMRPFLPRFTLASFRKVFGFSGWLTGVSFVAALNNKLDAFVLARVIGVSNTGNFYIGMQLADLPTSELASPIARAIYPGLSALQDQADRMRAAFLKGVEALGAIAMPISFGFAFVAHDLVTLLLGEKWRDAVPVVEFITPVLGLQTLFVATQFFAMALGKTHLVFTRELIFFLIRFPIFVWASIAYGLEGAIYATAGCGLLHVVLNLGVYASASGRPIWEPLWSARRSFAAVAAMSAYFLFLRPLAAGLNEAPVLLRLAADILAGAAVYLVVHVALWRLEGAPESVEGALVRLAQRVMARTARRPAE